MLRDAGLWHARGVRPERRDRPRREGARAVHVPQAAPDDHGGHVRPLLQREVPAARRRAALPARPRRPRRQLLLLLVRRRSPSTPRATGSGYVGEADLYGLRTEMLPSEVEPELWRFAEGDRVAFENYSDLLDRTALPPERALSRRATHRPGSSPSPRSPSDCTGRRWRTPIRSRSVCWRTPTPSSSALGSRTLAFDELRERLGADAPRARGRAARRLPPRAPAAARRAAALAGASRPSGRSPPRSPAGRPRAGSR